MSRYILQYYSQKVKGMELDKSKPILLFQDNFIIDIITINGYNNIKDKKVTFT